MAYFELDEKKPLQFKPYGFDYHSHFPGILPVESDRKWGKEAQAFTAQDANFTVSKDQELSLIGVLIHGSLKGNWPVGAEALKAEKRKAHSKLFRLALKYMIAENPFKATDFTSYRRGECAGENIYLACLILLRKFGFTGVYAPNESLIFETVYELLKNGTINKESSYPILAYFNRKIFSANKYTPFDDAYWARSAVRDNPKYKVAYNWLTLCYLYREAIVYTQTAMSASGAEEMSKYFCEFNNKMKTSYKILAHTAHVYENEGAFVSELNKIKNLFVSTGGAPKIPDLVGLDLLGSEVRDGQYKQFFDFLINAENRAVFETYTRLASKPTKRVVLHVHCGEGSGVSGANRSLCGYFLRNISGHGDRKPFYEDLAAYVWTCFENTLAQAQARTRERVIENRRIKDEAAVSGLFDELFYNDSLTLEGLHLRRFDITAPASQSLVSYSAQANIMNLISALGGPSGQVPETRYDAICTGQTPYTMRIGHAYAFRNYFGAKFPLVYFDTNLGSNFITGASRLFDSAAIYRLNRGLRHLDGFMDSATLDRSIDAVIDMGPNRLNRDQKQIVGHLACLPRDELDGSRASTLVNNLLSSAGVPIEEEEQSICKVLKTFLLNQYKTYLANNPPASANDQDTLKTSQRIRRIDAYEKLAAIAINWRAYILGADGQGVEHSNVQIEALRMTLLLAYGLDYRELGFTDSILNEFNALIFNISALYWCGTIGGPLAIRAEAPMATLRKFEGFTSPGSVVQVRTEGL